MEISDSDRKARKIFGITLSCIFMAIGVFFLTLVYNSIKSGMESAKWPFTEGKIIKSEVVKQEDLHLGSGHTKTTTYSAKIEYEYSVSSQNYRGGSIKFGDEYAVKEEANKYVHKYPLGATVRVYYNPQKADMSVLEPGLKLNVVGVIFALVFICLAVFILVKDKEYIFG